MNALPSHRGSMAFCWPTVPASDFHGRPKPLIQGSFNLSRRKRKATVDTPPSAWHDTLDLSVSLGGRPSVPPWVDWIANNASIDSSGPPRASGGAAIVSVGMRLANPAPSESRARRVFRAVVEKMPPGPVIFISSGSSSLHAFCRDQTRGRTHDRRQRLTICEIAPAAGQEFPGTWHGLPAGATPRPRQYFGSK